MRTNNNTRTEKKPESRAWLVTRTVDINGGGVAFWKYTDRHVLGLPCDYNVFVYLRLFSFISVTIKIKKKKKTKSFVALKLKPCERVYKIWRRCGDKPLRSENGF